MVIIAAAATPAAVQARPESLHLGLLALHARAPLLAQPLVPPPHVLLVPSPPAGRVPSAVVLLAAATGATTRGLRDGVLRLRPPLGEPALVPGEVPLQLGRLRPQVVRARARGLARARHGRRRRRRCSDDDRASRRLAALDRLGVTASCARGCFCWRR